MKNGSKGQRVNVKLENVCARMYAWIDDKDGLNNKSCRYMF